MSEIGCGLGCGWGVPGVPKSIWFKQKCIRDKIKIVNYCVLINKLSELMGDEFIQLKKKKKKQNKKKHKCTADEQFHLANNK